MSYFSQMVALVIQNFFSPAVGLCVAAVFVRGIARRETSFLGNFWVDLTRAVYYLLLPISLVGAMVFLATGSPQNFKPYDTVKFLDPFTTQVPKTDANNNPVVDAKGQPVMVNQTVDTQTIAEGPIASQLSIKMLGTNGGGYMNVNAAHPFENGTPFCNFFQMIYFIGIASGMTYYLGLSVGSKKHGWAVWIAMFVMLLPCILVCWHFEAAGNPIHHALGVDPADGNMEGKEVRFGIFNSALFATTTTATGCGAVNSMHDSFTPIGGLIPIFNIQLGEVVFGGVGAGLYGILVYVAVTVFIAGLMIGRTPEYLGKKVQSYEVKMASFYLLIFAAIILGFSAWGALSNWGPASTDPVTHAVIPGNGTNNNGPHGLTEILYAFSEAAGNNGSAFAGLSANAPGYNTALGIAILLGRFGMLIPCLAIAGSLARKKVSPPGPGSFPVHSPTFVIALIGVVVLVGALNFLPVLALGPIVEHFLMLSRQYVLTYSQTPTYPSQNGCQITIHLRSHHCRSGNRRVLQEAEPGSHGQEPGYVRDRGRRGDHHRAHLHRTPSTQSAMFLIQITLWLWFTVVFANFAEAMAEGRGKAQADTLRKTRTQTYANRIVKGG